MIALTSIPPANRHTSRRRIPLNTISSLRAATRTGFTFVGGQVGSAQPNAPEKNDFRPKVSLPDLQYQKQKEEYHKSLQILAKSTNDLLVSATEPGEIAFWQSWLKRLEEARWEQTR